MKSCVPFALFLTCAFFGCSDDGGESDAPILEGVGGTVDATGGEASAGGSTGGGAEASESGGAAAGGDRATGGRAGSGGGSGGVLPSEPGGAFSGGSGGGEAAGGANGGTGGLAAAGGGSGGAEENPEPSCAFAGNVRYVLNAPETWPEDVFVLLTASLAEAEEYYNCYADLSKEITVNYKPGVPTAEANVDGQMSFGSDKTYMVTATVMHETAHTLGVAYSPWLELMDEGRWTGPAVNELMRALPSEERDPDSFAQRDYITGDNQHIWPYGLNHASEHVSEWSLINHVRIVAAINEDKRAYLAGEL